MSCDVVQSFIKSCKLWLTRSGKRAYRQYRLYFATMPSMELYA
jgi:hypothetical protein